MECLALGSQHLPKQGNVGRLQEPVWGISRRRTRYETTSEAEITRPNFSVGTTCNAPPCEMAASGIPETAAVVGS